jgi:hypothetical protein
VESYLHHEHARRWTQAIVLLGDGLVR